MPAPEIVYENDELVCVCKPAGMPSQPDPTGQTDLLTLLQARYGDERQVRVGLVHRLDTPTGGVMVYAKTAAALSRLSALVQNHETFVKEYLCVLPDAPVQPVGELTDELYHDKTKNKSFVVKTARAGSKAARLEYEVLSRAQGGETLCRVRLYTGRTHQIRVQFASRGLPLLGDGKYGSRIKCPLALWSWRLRFPDASGNTTVTAKALPTADEYPWTSFEGALRELREGDRMC